MWRAHWGRRVQYSCLLKEQASEIPGSRRKNRRLLALFPLNNRPEGSGDTRALDFPPGNLDPTGASCFPSLTGPGSDPGEFSASLVNRCQKGHTCKLIQLVGFFLFNFNCSCF